MASHKKNPLSSLMSFFGGGWRPPVPAEASAEPARAAHRAPLNYTVEESSSQFRVFASRDGRVIGTCVASASSHKALNVCFVNDVIVHDEAQRGHGIGTELVRRALEHSGCAVVMPVRVVREAAVWWAKLVASGTLPVQLGVTFEQEHMLRYAVGDGRAASPVAPAAPRLPEAPARTSAQAGRLGRLPELVAKVALNHLRSPTSPSPTGDARFTNGAGEVVGGVGFALSPLGDRVYICDIRVADEHRRCGYATAMLWHLAREYGRPLTPVRVVHAANGFWNHARTFAAEGLHVTETVWDLDEEAQRWAHLRPEADRLDAQIHARLYEAHEPWAVAVGRGLDAPPPAARVAAARVADCDSLSPG